MLAHKSIDIRPQVWKQARINAELSGVALRDYISFLLVTSKPVAEDGGEIRRQLETEVRLNHQAGQTGKTKD